MTCTVTASTGAGSASATSAQFGPIILAKAPLGAVVTFWGDSVNSEGAAPGVRNWPTWALASFNSQLMPSKVWMQ